MRAQHTCRKGDGMSPDIVLRHVEIVASVFEFHITSFEQQTSLQ